MEINVFLNKSEKGRYWYSSSKFIEHTIVGKSGESYECLAPVGNQDLRQLPPDAIKSFIMPEELNELSREDMAEEFGEVAKLNTETGELILI